MSSLDIVRGRQVIEYMTNSSGVQLAEGDVVVSNSGANDSVTTQSGVTESAIIGVVQDTILYNGSNGRILTHGYAPKINVNGSNVTRGHFLFTGVAKAAGTNSSRGAGAFGIIRTSGTTPDATLFGSPDQTASGGSVATDAIWDAAGDLAVGSGANTAARVAIGANATVLTSNGTTAAWAAPAAPTFAGARATRTTNLAVTTATYTAVTLPDAETYDTSSYHDTTTNSDRMTVPAGKAGKYSIKAIVGFESVATSYRLVALRFNNATPGNAQIALAVVAPVSGSQTWVSLATDYVFAEGEYVAIDVYHERGSNLNCAGAYLSFSLIGS